jgi:ubiquitin-activating enzyme E1
VIFKILLRNFHFLPSVFLPFILIQITQDVIGVVTVAHGERHDFEDGDVVRVSEVKGMAELNDKIFKITWKSPYSFSIGDTSGFGSYINGGYFEQVKVPKKFSHQPLSFFFEEGNFPADKALMMDYSKFDKPAQYNIFLQALLQFRETHDGRTPTPRNVSDAEEVLAFAKSINDKRTNDKVEEIDENLIRLLAKTSAGDISPMATIFGGIVGQEVIKGTAAKYTPIDQWFLFESLECLGEEVSEADCAPRGSRYDGQIAIFGKGFQEKLGNLKYFLVGAGAIGCEVLKCWAMMGVSAGPEGHIDVTDMDQIEISNLNRQFLYRPWDVSKFKSEVAATAAKKMNKDMKVNFLTNKVGPETENTFNDNFWNRFSGVCNALDNVQARLYVDSRCVFFNKSLLESGTLGTKGNTQVVVPKLTESYGSSRDPPTKETPMCTLHFFPNNIQHCLQWAREDLFEGSFTQSPDMLNQYIEKPDYLKTIAPQQLKLTLDKLKSLLVTDKPKNFDDCIKWARLEFEIQYNHKVRQLLYNFPADFVDQHGVPFWSGAKRPPTPTTFDTNNPLHLDFIVAASYLRAYTYGLITSELKPIDLEETVEQIRRSVGKFEIPEFVPQKVKIPTQPDDSAGSRAVAEPEENEDEVIQSLQASLPKPEDFNSWRVRSFPL